MTLFAEEIREKDRLAKAYSRELRERFTVPHVPENAQSVWAQYTIRSPERDRMLSVLKEAGIPSAVYYPKPLHLQRAFAGLGYGPGSFPVSESAAGTVFSLPMHAYLDHEQAAYVTGVLNRA